MYRDVAERASQSFLSVDLKMCSRISGGSCVIIILLGLTGASSFVVIFFMNVFASGDFAPAPSYLLTQLWLMR
jgi:hypothetical protein